MAARVHTVPYGAPALECLAALVGEAQAADRLAPVTVVVPTNYVGVATRRALARRGGIAGVSFLTAYRLAELLGAAPLARGGRRPVSTPVLAGAVRQALRARARLLRGGAGAPGHGAGARHRPSRAARRGRQGARPPSPAPPSGRRTWSASTAT